MSLHSIIEAELGYSAAFMSDLLFTDGDINSVIGYSNINKILVIQPKIQRKKPIPGSRKQRSPEEKRASFLKGQATRKRNEELEQQRIEDKRQKIISSGTKRCHRCLCLGSGCIQCPNSHEVNKNVTCLRSEVQKELNIRKDTSICDRYKGRCQMCHEEENNIRISNIIREEMTRRLIKEYLETDTVFRDKFYSLDPSSRRDFILEEISLTSYLIIDIAMGGPRRY